jgi:hypothetical protein
MTMGMSYTQSYIQILHNTTSFRLDIQIAQKPKNYTKYPPFSYINAKIKIKTKFFIKKLIQPIT